METFKLPVAVLRGLVAFPQNDLSFDAGRKETIAAINEAIKGDKRIFLTSQKDVTVDKLDENSGCKMGVVGTITQSMKLPGGITRVIVKCLARAEMVGCEKSEFLTGQLVPVTEYTTADEFKTDALMRELQLKFQDYFAADNRFSPDSYMWALSKNGASAVADSIAAAVPFDVEIKQEILEELNVEDRIKLLMVKLITETELITLQSKIDGEVKKQIDKNQQEYYLREQMKVIERELGDKDGSTEEMVEYRKKITELNLDKKWEEKLLKEVDKLAKVGNHSAESGVIKTYLDAVLGLPWNVKTEENLDIENASEILDEDHYGLDKVKESILLNLAVRNFNARGSNILCLVGPPGVGKTSIVRSIAKAIGRNYVRVSLGGVHDEADIRGHRKTYIGAMPGRIMSAVSQAGSNNALVLLDEIDKVGSDYRGDPSAALLEVLDSEQNFSFRDHYLEIPFDLSDIMFITTANTLDTISRPLLDRMDVIEVSGYTREEKLMIAKKHLFRKALEKTGMTGKRVTIADSALYEIIDYYTRESGVRRLEQLLVKVLSKAAVMYIKENRKSLSISKKLVGEMLGKRIYLFEHKNQKNEIGVARGLAWTAVGGDTLSVEVNVMEGTGKTELTGKLGDVMKESAVAAISYLRSVSDKYKIPEFYKTKDVHIHVPEGAVPKDGPSAGITIATATYSALTGKKIKKDVAMTGEITLRGRVLPIGGLKEKSLAAHRAGINTVIIPFENIKDLDDIPENIKDEMNFVPVKTMDEVLSIAISE